GGLQPCDGRARLDSDHPGRDERWQSRDRWRPRVPGRRQRRLLRVRREDRSRASQAPHREKWSTSESTLVRRRRHAVCRRSRRQLDHGVRPSLETARRPAEIKPPQYVFLAFNEAFAVGQIPGGGGQREESRTLKNGRPIARKSNLFGLTCLLPHV